MPQHFGHMRLNGFRTMKQIKILYLALSFVSGALLEFRNSSHLFCYISFAKNHRGAKNMTLIL
jgi:hypothetical protein